MRRDQVFKYGPLPPSPGGSNLIKYGPLRPREPEPVEPEEQGNKEREFLLKQIAKCLKETEKILEKAETETVVNELGRCLAELTLLYLRLSSLPKSGWNRTIEYTPGREERDFLIVYIVTTPAAMVDELQKKFK